MYVQKFAAKVQKKSHIRKRVCGFLLVFVSGTFYVSPLRHLQNKKSQTHIEINLCAFAISLSVPPDFLRKSFGATCKRKTRNHL